MKFKTFIKNKKAQFMKNKNFKKKKKKMNKNLKI